MAWIETTIKSESRFIYEPRKPKPDAYLPAPDVDLVRSVYAPDPMFIGQGLLTAIGIEEIVALCAGFLSNLEVDVQFDITKVVSGAKFPGFPG